METLATKTVLEPVGESVTNPGEEQVGRILTPEEQREVAIKVVGFFIMLILGSFVLLYIYHRCSQSRARSAREKKTFFEFLAGEIDDTYPARNQVASNSNAQYQL